MDYLRSADAAVTQEGKQTHTIKTEWSERTREGKYLLKTHFLQ